MAAMDQMMGSPTESRANVPELCRVKLNESTSVVSPKSSLRAKPDEKDENASMFCVDIDVRVCEPLNQKNQLGAAPPRNTC